MFNKREVNIIEKANEQLQEVQANCSARLLDKSDIEDTVLRAKKVFNELDNVERKWILKLVAINEYTIPVNYRYPAKTSRITVTINRYGTLQEIHVSRERANKEPYGGGASVKTKCEYE